MVAVEPSEVTSLPTRRFSRAEYDRLVDLGFFGDERLELLHGMVVAMNPQGAPHAHVIRVLNRLLTIAVGDRGIVQPQCPLALSDDSEPEPDFAVLAPGDYRREHPKTALLVVEVADSSQRKDRLVKAPLYASAGVPEYWIVLVTEGVVEVHREPHEGRYRRLETVGRGATIELVALPGVAIAADDILP